MHIYTNKYVIGAWEYNYIEYNTKIFAYQKKEILFVPNFRLPKSLLNISGGTQTVLTFVFDKTNVENRTLKSLCNTRVIPS